MRQESERAPPYPGMDAVLQDGNDVQYESIIPPAHHHQYELALGSQGEEVSRTAASQNPHVLDTLPETKEKRFHGSQDTRRDYKLVSFAEGDPANPKNWSKAYKWYCTMVVAITCFVVAFASSVITADIGGVMRDFNVSEEAALVSITVFVVGFGVGMCR
jgi:hypothetical protein